jgi:hypothetical protein
LVVALAGQLVATGDRWEPYRLVDGDGTAVDCAGAYFGHLQAAGRAELTVRSYGMDLLRWFRPEPPKKIMSIGTQRRLRPARGLQITEELRDRLHRLTGSVDEPVGLPRITGFPQGTRRWDGQRRQIPRRVLVFDHEQGP